MLYVLLFLAALFVGFFWTMRRHYTNLTPSYRMDERHGNMQVLIPRLALRRTWAVQAFPQGPAQCMHPVALTDRACSSTIRFAATRGWRWRRSGCLEAQGSPCGPRRRSSTGTSARSRSRGTRCRCSQKRWTRRIQSGLWQRSCPWSWMPPPPLATRPSSSKRSGARARDGPHRPTASEHSRGSAAPGLTRPTRARLCGRRTHRAVCRTLHGAIAPDELLARAKAEMLPGVNDLW